MRIFYIKKNLIVGHSILFHNGREPHLPELVLLLPVWHVCHEARHRHKLTDVPYAIWPTLTNCEGIPPREGHGHTLFLKK